MHQPALLSSLECASRLMSKFQPVAWPKRCLVGLIIVLTAVPGAVKLAVKPDGTAASVCMTHR